MVIHDLIYGTHEIDSPVLVDLIGSQAMQRLKGIAQLGMPDELNFRVGYSRFEHCVGVMLLLRKYGASEEEQVAGLLHDVSHTAFSHVIDFFVADPGTKEGFQDSQHERYIRTTDIPDILARYGYVVERVADYRNFSLLERSTPHLCADRLDYSLRELGSAFTAKILLAITVKEGALVFENEESALVFAREYSRMQREHWGGYESASRFTIFVQVLRRAMELGVIAFDDFWQRDEDVLAKVRAVDDTFIRAGIALLSQRSLAQVPRRPHPIMKKFRFIDPGVIVDGAVVALTSVHSAYAAELELDRQENAKGILIAEFNG